MKKNTSSFKELSTSLITICFTVLNINKIRHFINKFTFVSVLFFVSLSSQPVLSQWSATNYSGNINSVYWDGSNLLAGTNGGSSSLFSPDNGTNWNYANNGMTQYTDIRTYASNSTYLFAGTNAGDGIYRANNNGTYSWTKVLPNVSCFSLLVNGTDIFAGTMGDGIFYSSDNGANWIQVNTGLTMPYVYSLAFDGQYIYAGTYHYGTSNGGGVFRSNNNGNNWSSVNNGLTNSNIMSLAVNGPLLFAGTNGGGIYSSSDHGDNWQNVANGVVHTLKVDCNRVIYAGLLSSGGIIRSADNGNTWTTYNTGLPTSGGLTVMSIDKSSNHLFAGTLGGGVAISDLNCVTQQSPACISWNLLSSQAVTASTGNISGQSEIISAGSSTPLMVVYGYSNNGQQLWVGNTGWIPFPTILPAEDPLRYLEFNASPTTGNDLTVNNIYFNYGDLPLNIDLQILSFLVYYSTDNWSTRTLASNSALVYLNTAMNLFNISGLSVSVPNGQTFSMRIYPYPILHGITTTPTFAIHNNVTICGTTEPAKTGSICGTKFNDFNGDGIQNSGEPNLAGWTINLTYNSALGGPISLTTTTDATGNYCFNELAANTYTVSEAQQNGWTETSPAAPGTHVVKLGAGQKADRMDFGNQQISGNPCIFLGNPDFEQFLNVTPPTTFNWFPQANIPYWETTASDGLIEIWHTGFGSVPAYSGNYFAELNATQVGTLYQTFYASTVQPVIVSFAQKGRYAGVDVMKVSIVAPDGTPTDLGTYSDNNTAWKFYSTVSYQISTPGTYKLKFESISSNNGNGPSDGGNFLDDINVTCPSSICGIKFNDINGDGIQNAGEPVLSDWEITLTGPITLTTKTAKDGSYCFNNLPSGTYTLSETQQIGWTQTYPASPGNYSIILIEGQNNKGIDFGNQQVSSSNCIQPPSGMIGWWPGDGNANDISGFNNNGTLIGGATYTTGKVANSFNVSTVSDLVSIPDNPSLNFGTGSFSIDAWVQTIDTLSAIGIVDKLIFQGDITNFYILGYGLFIQQGRLEFHMGQGAISIDKRATLNNIGDGNWHLVAITVDRTNSSGGKMFIDGNLVFTFDPTLVPNSITNTRSLTLGELLATTILKPIVTKIDEVEIFNRVVSQSEISSIFNAGSSGKCKPGSICGSKFNDLNGNGIKDAGEPGIPNWKIILEGTANTSTLTDKNGDYCFTGLTSGNYTVTEELLSGWTQTAPAAGNYNISLASGENISNQIFGNTLRSCVKAWTPLTSGTNGEVWALAVIGTDLYVGGNFTTAGGNTANHIAKWNGSAWSPLVSSNNGVNGLNGMVSALTVIGTDLYAGGWFTTAGGIPALNIAKWDGSNWTALGSGISAAGAINALIAMGNNIYATSYILDPALGGPGNIIAKWDGSSWSQFSSMNDYVSSFLVDGSNLYAGGQFTMAGVVPANHIAKWDGTNWSSLGTGTSNGTNYYIGGTGLVRLAGKLYVGGRFTTAGGNAANFIANWDGTNWSSFINGSNNGMDNSVEGFAVMGSDLYASGSFLTAVGVSAKSVAKWDGTVWSPLGTGMNDGVWRMAVIGSDLYAGGIFTTAGGNIANYIAKYSCSGTTAINELKMNEQYQLIQNQPNPFNSTTIIKYYVPQTGFVKISVYDIFGKEIKVLVNGVKDAGYYENNFDGSELSSGVYFYSISTDSFAQSKKMILLK